MLLPHSTCFSQVRALASDPRYASLSSLVSVFAHGSLADFEAFVAKEPALIADIGLDYETRYEVVRRGEVVGGGGRYARVLRRAMSNCCALMTDPARPRLLLLQCRHNAPSDAPIPGVHVVGCASAKPWSSGLCHSGGRAQGAADADARLTCLMVPARAHDDKLRIPRSLSLGWCEPLLREQQLD